MLDHVDGYIAMRDPDGAFGPLQPLRRDDGAAAQAVQAIGPAAATKASTSELFPGLAAAICAAYRRDAARQKAGIGPL